MSLLINHPCPCIWCWWIDWFFCPAYFSVFFYCYYFSLSMNWWLLNHAAIGTICWTVICSYGGSGNGSHLHNCWFGWTCERVFYYIFSIFSEQLPSFVIRDFLARIKRGRGENIDALRWFLQFQSSFLQFRLKLLYGYGDMVGLKFHLSAVIGWPLMAGMGTGYRSRFSEICFISYN